jgi:cyclic di-GMP phosphodiesterase
MPVRAAIPLRGAGNCGGRYAEGVVMSPKSHREPMKILVIDDEEVTLEFVTTMVENAGYRVEQASDGEEGWDKICSLGLRLVLMDWEMPRLNGVQLCRRIRETPLPGYTYIILVTGHGSVEDIVAGMSAGADDFVPKPFCPEELLARIRAGERVLGLETRDVTIFAMAKLAESRDPETGGHLERIRAYSRILARNMVEQGTHKSDLDDKYVQTLELTSALHDIGKVGVPDSILLKPGQLNDSEFGVMKDHTLIGGQALEAALKRTSGLEFLRMAYDIAIAHHERFDGSGYPLGLVGHDIPLSARIVALADVYDALISKRPYKEPLTHVVARGVILEGRGSHFDPLVVDAFVACEDEFAETAAANPQ